MGHIFSVCQSLTEFWVQTSPLTCTSLLWLPVRMPRKCLIQPWTSTPAPSRLLPSDPTAINILVSCSYSRISNLLFFPQMEEGVHSQRASFITHVANLPVADHRTDCYLSLSILQRYCFLSRLQASLLTGFWIIMWTLQNYWCYSYH